MEQINKYSVIHEIKMPREAALAFSKTILAYIKVPALEQIIILPNDNDLPFIFENYVISFNTYSIISLSIS